jgi:hypothetical protein
LILREQIQFLCAIFCYVLKKYRTHDTSTKLTCNFHELLHILTTLIYTVPCVLVICGQMRSISLRYYWLDHGQNSRPGDPDVHKTEITRRQCSVLPSTVHWGFWMSYLAPFLCRHADVEATDPSSPASSRTPSRSSSATMSLASPLSPA